MRLSKLLYLFIFVSSIFSAILYLNHNASSDLYLSDGSKSFDLDYSSKAFSIGFAYPIIESDTTYFSLLFGLSHSASPLEFKTNNSTANKSKLNISYLYLMPRYSFTDKVSGWVSLGLNIIKVDYFKVNLPYDYYRYNINYDNCLEYECTEYVNTQTYPFIQCVSYNYNNCLKYEQWYDSSPTISYDAVPYEFTNVESYGNLGIGIGLDVKVYKNLTLGIARYYSKVENILGYDKSIFENKMLDLTLSRWGLHLGYDF